MVYDIVLGRDQKDIDRFGTDGSVFIGKNYVKMGAVSALSQPVFLDLNKAHVVFVCGKRGTGKSYFMGVLAEGISLLPDVVRNRLSVVMFDTMGIYWTMKYPNNRDDALLKEWGLEGKAIDVKIYTPFGFFKKWKELGIPTDVSFALNPAELSGSDWCLAFDLSSSDSVGVFIESIIAELRKSKSGFDIRDILVAIDESSEELRVKQAARNRFVSVEEWGVFSASATPMRDLVKPGQVCVLDLSAYAIMPNGWRIKHIVMGLLCNKLFVERMKARKDEEYAQVHEAIHYLVHEHDEPKSSDMPICWLLIDEAHEFLPSVGKTASSDALITLLREGRQPGIALVLATQQPGKIHTDAMTQSDIILAHRLTAKVDTDALGSLLQSYLRTGLDKELENLPRVPGSCIAVDDVTERMFSLRVRPRFSWHGGGAPNIIQEKKEIYKF